MKKKPAGTKSAKAKATKSAKATKPSTGKSPAQKAKSSPSIKPGPSEDGWNLRLYVAGQTPRSLTAFSNLKRLCEEHLQGSYKIEVVDLMKHPELAQRDQIVAIPTLVRKLPAPIKRVVGDLSNLEKVMVGIEIRPMVMQG